MSACTYAQTSELYAVETRFSNSIHVWEDGGIVRRWESPGPHTPPIGDTGIAVASEVRTINSGLGRNGHEWTLEGSPTGQTYPNPGFFLSDGTTDGLNHNYVLTDSGVLFRFDREWSSPVQLFQVLGANGVAFDPHTNSLWIAVQSRLENHALDGTLLSFFVYPVTSGAHGGLAFDPVDRTLWYADTANNGLLRQLSSEGEVLQVVPLSGQDYLGLEFAVPEPTSALLLALTALLLGTRRMR